MKKFAFAILILACAGAHGAVEIGSGLTSTTGGRVVPSLAGAIHFSDRWTLSGFSTGVRSQLYYHSGYSIALYRTWASGKFLGGDIVSGLGLGVYYAQRGLQQSNSSEQEKSSDFVVGPSYRVHWSILRPLFLNMDATFGLLQPGNHLALAFQDVISLSVGAEF